VSTDTANLADRLDTPALRRVGAAAVRRSAANAAGDMVAARTNADESHVPLPGQLRYLIIVPAFNESRSVAKLVRRIRRTLPEFDVLVIDDGSTDDTVRQIPHGTAVVSLPFNLGIGGAMQTGYRYADLHRYDVAVQVDGDGQHRPKGVRALVRPLLADQADMVVGSRFLGSTHFRQSMPRMTGIKLLGVWIQLLTGLRITDCTSGFRAVNRRVIHAYAHWYPEDYPEPEVALLLHRSRFRVLEIPAKMRRRMYGRSSISLLQGLFYVLKVSVCLSLDMMREPWPKAKLDHYTPGGCQ